MNDDNTLENVRRLLNELYNTGWTQKGEGLEGLEREIIRMFLLRNKGVQQDAAKELGISPRVISYKIKSLGLRQEWRTPGTELHDVRLPYLYNAVSQQQPVVPEPTPVEAPPTATEPDADPAPTRR